MDDIHQQKIKDQNIEQKTNNNSSLPPQNSQFLNLYNEAISDLVTSDDIKTNSIDVLTSFGINYTKTLKEDFFSVNVKRHTPNYEIICLLVQYGPFSIEFTVLNIASRSNVHSLKPTSSSKGCCVYIEPSVLEGRVIKCFPKKQEENFQWLLIKVVKEVFIFKIADCLEIGPRIGPLPSFDIIVYEDCIQFSMEQCQMSESLSLQYFQQQSWKRLRQKLYLLHQLQIVHMDIKPSNICLSPFTSQLIFIDFGLSAILLEEIGYKTSTLFAGSLNFCSPQMKNCYVQEKRMNVDLYYNDIYSLNSSLKAILENEEGIKMQKNNDAMKGNIDVMNKDSLLKLRKKFIQQFHLQTRVKYLLYMQQTNLIIENTTCKEYVLSHLQEILQYCFMLPDSKSIELLYDFIKKSKRTETQFMLIKRRNIEEYGILKNQSVENTQLAKRFHLIEKGIYFTVQQLQNCQIFPQQNENVRQLLLSQKMCATLPKQIYFQKLSPFISLKLRHSTFEEKIAAVKILIGLQKIELASDEGSLQILKIGSQYILEYLLEQQFNSKNCIPLLYFNLILLNFSPQKLLDIFRKISIIKANSSIQTLVLFKCFSMISWAGQLQISLSDFKLLKMKFDQLFLEAIRQRKQNMKVGHKDYNQILLIEQLIEITQLHDYYERATQMMETINKMNHFDPQLKHQITIYLHSLLIYGNHVYQPINLNSIRHINFLNQQQIYSKSKELEYYHIAILDFFIDTNNKKGISIALAKIVQYLNNEDILAKLAAFQQCIRIKTQQQQNFYQAKTHLPILRIINDDPNDQQGIILSHYSNVIKMTQFETSHLDNQCQQIISLIRDHLLRIYPITSKQELHLRFEKYKQKYIICQLIKIYISVMRSLHASDPRYPLFFTDLLEVIKDFKPQCGCSSCQTNYRSFIEYNKIIYLNDTKRYQQILPILDQYLQRKQAYGQQFGYNCIFYMLFVFESKIEFSEALQMRTNLLIKWMNDSNSWMNLFYNTKYSTKQLELLYCLILNMDMKQQFCAIHRMLTNILAQYPTYQLLQTYCVSLIKAYYNWPDQLKEITEYILSHKEMLKSEQIGQYYALFISSLINYHITQEKLEKALLLFILKNINKVNSIAKIIIQKNVFFYLTRASVIWERSQIISVSISKRNSKAILKKYFRMPLVQISLSQLEYYYFNDLRRNKLVPQAVRNIIKTLARKFLNNSKLQEEQSLKPLQFRLISPFAPQ